MWMIFYVAGMTAIVVPAIVFAYLQENGDRNDVPFFLISKYILHTYTSKMKMNFTAMLQIAFIVLKLTQQIDWGWHWVLSPIWIPYSMILIGKLILKFLNER